MLAKEVKIKTLKRQREFIEEKLMKISTSQNDGDSSYSYVGYVYPEVIKYFEDEGFVVTPVKSEMVTAMAKGRPVYLFTVGDIKLSEEELKQAEEYEVEVEEDEDKDDLPDFIRALLGGGSHMPEGIF